MTSSASPSPASLAMIERLIGFPTVSRDSNLALIDWVRDYLDGLGVDSLLVHDETGTKANLYATLGPADRPGLLLSGHSDVVPVDGQDWQSDPFRAVRKDGRIYGRGAADMKSFLGICLAMAPEFLAQRLATPIHLAFSYDEEVGCIGVRRLLDRFAEMPVKPRACIIGEPTEMKVVTAHKGKSSWYCEIRGHECHSSLAHTGVNAVEIGAELVTRLRRIAQRKRDNGPFDAAYDPPYTTVQTGVMAGGTALNIVPGECRFEFEFRYLPEDPPEPALAELEAFAREVLEPEMRSIHPDTGIRFALKSGFPGLATSDDAEITRLAKALSGANATGKVSFGTEGGLYQAADIPTVICGPGSIEQAHKPDEWISLEQVALCETFLHRLLESVRAP